MDTQLSVAPYAPVTLLVTDMNSGMTLEVAPQRSTLLEVASIPAGLTLEVSMFGPVTLDVTGVGVQGISGFCGGRPISNEVVLFAVAPYDFTITPTRCKAKALLAAQDGAIFEVRKNGTPIFTFEFPAGGNVATMSAVSDRIVLKGDELTITCVPAADAQLGDITFLIVE